MCHCPQHQYFSIDIRGEPSTVLTQFPDYKQLYILTYCNQKVMGPHKSTWRVYA